MSKSKNHTNHNQNKKAHKNGIHRVKSQKYRSLKGVSSLCVYTQDTHTHHPTHSRAGVSLQGAPQARLSGRQGSYRRAAGVVAAK